MESPPGWWKMSCWGGLEPNVCAGPSCSFPAPRAAGRVHLPHTREKEEAQEGLSGTSPSLSHISVLCGFRRRVALVGKDGCSVLLAEKWMAGVTPPSSLAKTGVSHAPLWCGLHFTRNVAAAGPKEKRALDVRARKHNWVLLICNNVAPSWVLSWET